MTGYRKSYLKGILLLKGLQHHTTPAKWSTITKLTFARGHWGSVQLVTGFGGKSLNENNLQPIPTTWLHFCRFFFHCQKTSRWTKVPGSTPHNQLDAKRDPIPWKFWRRDSFCWYFPTKKNKGFISCSCIIILYINQTQTTSVFFRSIVTWIFPRGSTYAHNASGQGRCGCRDAKNKRCVKIRAPSAISRRFWRGDGIFPTSEAHLWDPMVKM